MKTNVQFPNMEKQTSTPRFTHSAIDDRHFKNLRTEIQKALEQLPSHRKYYPLLKAFLLPALYFTLFFFSLQQTHYIPFFVLYLSMGVAVVFIFINLIHDACHYTLFQKNRKANEWYMLVFDLLGANSFIWRKRHVRLHHNYPNIAGWDSDIEKSDFLKVHPNDKSKEAGPLKKFLVILYPLFVLNWFLIRDFRDYFTSNTLVRKIGAIPKIEYVKLLFFKLLYLAMMVGVPVWLTPFTLVQVLLALLGLMMMAGLFGLVILLPPHVNTYSQFPVASDDMDVEHSWLYHQLVTTNDVNLNNWFSRHLMANFNYHLIHHLFPKLSYVYAAEATMALRKYCLENDLPYRSISLFRALTAHFQLIFRNQVEFDIFENEM